MGVRLFIVVAAILAVCAFLYTRFKKSEWL